MSRERVVVLATSFDHKCRSQVLASVDHTVLYSTLQLCAGCTSVHAVWLQTYLPFTSHYCRLGRLGSL